MKGKSGWPKGRPRGGRPPNALNHHGIAQKVDPKLAPLYLARIGRALRDKRLELDIGAAELAKKIGSHASTIYRIERGERDMRMGLIVR